MACLQMRSVPGGRSLPATVGTFMPGARQQARPSCRAFVHCEVGTRTPIFTAEEAEVQRGAVAFPSLDSGDEGREG